MPQPPDRIPKSYDEITRRTVPEPDSSFRPTSDQERAAFEGERILSSDEQALHAKVADALGSSGADVSSVSIEIDGSRVTLRGRVSDVALLPQLESAVRTVDEVGDIVDLVVVDPGAE
jgi:BON domain-containing protein